MRDIDFRAGRLPGRAILSVQGPEAGHFLHNLLTSDIDHLAEGQAAYAALLTPQGKILFDMFVVRQGDGYLIDCAASQRADLMKRLAMYKLRAKVEIAARDDLAVGVSPVEDPRRLSRPAQRRRSAGASSARRRARPRVMTRPASRRGSPTPRLTSARANSSRTRPISTSWGA